MNILLKLWKSYVPYEIGDLLDIYDREKLPLGVRHHILSVSEGVARVAKTLMKKGHHINVRTLLEGSLLHDIGRAYTHGIYHGVVGAAVAKDLGFSEDVQSIIRNHLGAGIPKEVAISLGLPPRDFVPQTLEEKIVACVDNMARGPVIVDQIGMMEDWREKLKKGHVTQDAVIRVLELYKELSKMLGQDVYEVIISYGQDF